MLRIGLTGGIGAGKSTAARRLVERGAVLIDSDQLAREVVAPGTDGLARVVEAFGSDVLAEDGTLDRPALGRVVFADPEARTRLGAILHPLIGRRGAQLVEAAPAGAIVVQDVPLLVENQMAATFPLVVVVFVPADERVRRLVADRGMTEEEARSRIAAQTDDDARRSAADVWLDNSGSPDDTRAAVDRLWHERLVPFEADLRAGRPAVRPGGPRLVGPDPAWPAQAARLIARVAAAAGGRARRIDHIGSTSIPGLPANDVIDLQVGVASPDEAEAIGPALREAGFVALPEPVRSGATPADPARRSTRCYRSTDPGRSVDLHVRAADGPGCRVTLLLRDWLRDDPAARRDYLDATRAAAAEHVHDPDGDGYAQALESWFDAARPRADRWATSTGWRIPADDLGIDARENMSSRL